MAVDQLDLALTDKQKEVVDYNGEEVLIKGIAGSGKTTVILRRANKLLKKNPDLKIGIFTYNKSLTSYSKEMAKKIGSDNLKVYTFHGWGSSVLKDLLKTYNLNIFYDSDKKEALNKSIASIKSNLDHRFITEEKYKSFLLDEISWMKGKGFTTREEYKQAVRKGRGGEVRVTKQDRDLIYSLFESYEYARVGKGRIGFDDFARIIYDKKDQIKDHFKFDHVMVDEAQDLQQLQLQLLRFITKKGFVVAADKGQKIYKTSFSWKDIGLNILGGRTKILNNSFRSTKQIVEMANSLQLHDSVIHDDEYVKPVMPEYTGPIPEVYQCASRQVQDQAIVNSIKQIAEEYPGATIGVLAREWRSVGRIYHSIKGTEIAYEYLKDGKGNPTSPGVKFSSFHSAKGLEFDFVIILDLINDERADNKDIHDDEYYDVERRLLYVSITRAKKHLQVFYYKEPSRLLLEIDPSTYKKDIF
ncbi:UvrD-helicase domain-containing protein [Bacillus seohaeanensis]|uniref:DNA 3'-5' helicase n=1 Tax=Bacillus seohaeanensis TaxID=284580 RepID=A0ABW5RTU6_9BACI